MTLAIEKKVLENLNSWESKCSALIHIQIFSTVFHRKCMNFSYDRPVPESTDQTRSSQNANGPSSTEVTMDQWVVAESYLCSRNEDGISQNKPHFLKWDTFIIPETFFSCQIKWRSFQQEAGIAITSSISGSIKRPEWIPTGTC